MVIDLDDRQAERTFRAWEVVLSSQGNPNGGNSMKLALEYLNRDFDGFWCGEWIRTLSKLLTGNTSRACFIPKKDRALFIGVDFKNEILRGVRLANGVLISARLRGADLMGADLTGADLTGANLLGANLKAANLSGAGLKKAYLFGADLSGANLSTADLSESNLFTADLSGANLSRADLSGAGLADTNLAEADLEQIQLDTVCISPMHPPKNIPNDLTMPRHPCF